MVRVARGVVLHGNREGKGPGCVCGGKAHQVLQRVRHVVEGRTNRISDVSQEPAQQRLLCGRPRRGAFYCVWYGNLAGNDPASLPLMIEIEYIALMVEPRFIAQS